jgi:23S rRNA (uracil1939-C5)-methyltransferase
MLEGTIQDLAFGGKGILRNSEGKVVFIPFTIPGERIRYAITKDKKHYAEGALTEVLDPSPERITPACPYFTKCGGCQLQHIDYQAQVRYKKAAIEQALRTVYPDASIQMSPSRTPWGYRRRIHLTLHPTQNGFITGYIGQDNRSLVQVDQCPIFTSPDDPVIKITAEIAARLQATRTNSGKALLVKTGTEKYLLHFHFKELPKNAKEILSKSLKDPISAIELSAPRSHLSYGKNQLSMSIEGLQVSYSSDAFVQNHPDESALIYQEVVHLIKKISPEKMLDLYSGIGVSSLLAAPFCKEIDSVELNRHAVKIAKENASANQRGNICFHEGKVEEALTKLLKKNQTLALCNPPREGMDKAACHLIAASTVQDLLYISCHPATLARDLKIFKESGFIYEEGKGFDMFPQTGHVETLIWIKRPCACASSGETARGTD